MNSDTNVKLVLLDPVREKGSIKPQSVYVNTNSIIQVIRREASELPFSDVENYCYTLHIGTMNEYRTFTAESVERAFPILMESQRKNNDSCSPHNLPY